MAGTLLETGIGRKTPADIQDAFEKKDRTLAGFTAPAQGLILWDIQY
jgi:tRNA pseudouridine38-40 synthase